MNFLAETLPVLLRVVSLVSLVWFNKIIIIVIIISFYGAYILRNLSSEAQQNRIIKHNREHGCAKVIIKTKYNRRFMVEMQFEINVLSFFGK